MFAASSSWSLGVDVAVIGLGVVGMSMYRLFQNRMNVIGWDVNSEGPYPEAQISNADIAFVCVGTPRDEDGSADTTQVEAAVSKLSNDLVIIRSTIPPGTTDRLAEEYGLNICFWPEYIGESNYFNPYFPTEEVEVPFVTIGGNPLDRRAAIDALLPVLGPTKTYFQCSAKEAELAKYAENSFFAAKVTFANEIRKICEAMDADWHTVREAWLLDPRISRMHTAAFRDDRGFSGKCLPKDLDALIEAAFAAGYKAKFLEEIRSSNERFRPKDGVTPLRSTR